MDWKDAQYRDWQDPEHGRRITAKQYDLINHLQGPSLLSKARQAKKDGTCPSLSAFFMLNLMENSHGLRPLPS